MCVILIVTRHGDHPRLSIAYVTPFPPNPGCANSKVMPGGLFMQHSQGHDKHSHNIARVTTNTATQPGEQSHTATTQSHSQYIARATTNTATQPIQHSQGHHKHSHYNDFPLPNNIHCIALALVLDKLLCVSAQSFWTFLFNKL